MHIVSSLASFIFYFFIKGALVFFTASKKILKYEIHKKSAINSKAISY